MGRNKKYNEPTKVIAIRVPESKANELIPILNDYVGDYLKIADIYGISKEDALKPVKAANFNNCGCQLLGHSPTGSEIWKRCKEHKV